MPLKPAAFARLSRFTILSGIGWCMDVGLTLGLVAGGLAVAPANMIGATVAVSFVYVTAQRHIFQRKPGRLTAVQRGIAYAGYQVLAIAAASVLIGGLAWALQAALPSVAVTALAGISKIAITPLTLYSNFVFMGWLLEGRVAWR